MCTLAYKNSYFDYSKSLRLVSQDRSGLINETKCLGGMYSKAESPSENRLL